MEQISSLLVTRKQKKTKGGASHQWQDRAVTIWKKLGLDGQPSSGFFKIFKNEPKLAEQCYSFVVDANARTPERLFFWKFNDLKRIQK